MSFFQRFSRAVSRFWHGHGQTILTPQAFTQEFAEALRKASPTNEIEIVRDLELKFIRAENGPTAAFLYNFYDEYRLNPNGKAAVIDRFIAAQSDRSVYETEIDKSRIVPIIKDRAWVSESTHALIDRKFEKPPEMVFEVYNTELYIVYAEDLPMNLRYLTREMLQKCDVAIQDLRALACENLRRIIPPIQRHGEAGFYMITAGGTYEASLLIADAIWKSDIIQVEGEIVVAIPSRDVLLVTGSGRKEHIRKLREGAIKFYESGSYRLTPKLFVYRGGQFLEFTDAEIESQ